MPTKEELKELQSKSLEEKIQISTARIIEWYENWGGGKYIFPSQVAKTVQYCLI